MDRGNLVEMALRPGGFGPVEWVDEVSSTNTLLMDAARRGEDEGHVLIADSQTAGRGRRGRKWVAPLGSSLMMSVLLRPLPAELAPSEVHLATTALALAAASACEAVTGVRVGVKWPNDLVVEPPTGSVRAGDPGYRKVAGILTESVVVGREVIAVVPGIGINTGWEAVPEELALGAASLNLLSGQEVDRVELAVQTLDRFARRYRELCDGGVAQLINDVTAISATVGRAIRIADGGQEWTVGQALGLDQLGRLIVETDAGKKIFDIGDVEHLRLGES